MTRTNNNGVIEGWDGNGTTELPFTRQAGIYWNEANGLSNYTWTANGTATVTMTFNFNDDDGNSNNAIIRMNRNGSITDEHTVGDGGFTRTVSVIAGDIVYFHAGPSNQYFDNVSVSAE